MQTQTKGVFGTVWSKFTGRPKEAIRKLMAVKVGEVHGFVTRKDIGDIDLVYVNSKYGLAHIAEKHPEVVNELDYIVENGKIVSQGKDRVMIETPDHTGIVRLDWDGNKKQWTTTALEDTKRKNLASGSKTAAIKISPVDSISEATITNTIPNNTALVNGAAPVQKPKAANALKTNDLPKIQEQQSPRISIPEPKIESRATPKIEIVPARQFPANQPSSQTKASSYSNNTPPVKDSLNKGSFKEAFGVDGKTATKVVQHFCITFGGKSNNEIL